MRYRLAKKPNHDQSRYECEDLSEASQIAIDMQCEAIVHTSLQQFQIALQTMMDCKTKSTNSQAKKLRVFANPHMSFMKVISKTMT